MEPPFQPPPRTWRQKFGDAGRGCWRAVRQQSSFHVHVPVALAVVGCGAYWRISAHEWWLLVLCITTVLAAEMMNTALEVLAKAITRSHSEHIAAALDLASGAVLIASLGAALVGLGIFLPYFWPS